MSVSVIKGAASPARGVLAALIALAIIAGAGADAHAGPAAPARAVQPEPGITEVESQNFDGDTFPPEGWRTFDNEALARRREETYTWGRADCDLPVGAGNRYSAWGVGGGRLGDALLCGVEYDQPVESWLVREGIDASGFAGGLLVSFDIRFDVPTWVERSPSDPAYVPPPVRVCGSSATAGSFSCRRIFGQPGTEGRWVTTGANPVVLNMVAGQDSAAIAFIYTDSQPDGLYSGVMIDNVRIQGVSEAVAASPTPTGQQPTPTDPATTAVPTVAPTSFTPRDSQRAYLPAVIRSYDKVVDSPGVVPTALPGRVQVEFGTNVDITGRVENAGNRFDYGIPRLCAKQSWYDMPPGTSIRWQWYQYNAGAQRFDTIPGEQLNGSEVAQTPEGFANQCIRYVSEGTDVPVPANRYRVEVFLRGEAIPMAAGVAEVVGASGPQPTAGPSPTPKPLPEGCSDPLINGDFEAGPDLGWIQRTPSGEAIIRTEAVLSGTFSALLGRHLGAQEALISAVNVATLPAEDIEHVEVKFRLGMVTDETLGNGVHDDLFVLGVVNDANTMDNLPALSEETLAPSGSARTITGDITQLFIERPDYPQVAFAFLTQQSATSATNFIVDDVVLDFCLTSGQIVRVALETPPTVLGAGPIAFDRSAVGQAWPGSWGAGAAALPEGWRPSIR